MAASSDPSAKHPLCHGSHLPLGGEPWNSGSTTTGRRILRSEKQSFAAPPRYRYCMSGCGVCQLVESGVCPHLTAEHTPCLAVKAREIAESKEEAFSAHSAKRLALSWRGCSLCAGTRTASALAFQLMGESQVEARIGADTGQCEDSHTNFTKGPESPRQARQTARISLLALVLLCPVHVIRVPTTHLRIDYGSSVAGRCAISGLPPCGQRLPGPSSPDRGRQIQQDSQIVTETASENKDVPDGMVVR